MSKPSVLKPRKSPHQRRSAVTVEAIIEATIQVLLAEGPSRLTTTRVADRAGVSIGTMYQYFPQKRALFFTVLQHHLESIADELEVACRPLHGKTLVRISEGFADAHFKVNTQSFEVSKVIYSAARRLDAMDFDGRNAHRTYELLQSLLASASDAKFSDIGAATFILQQALAGVMRAIF
jgi:AcrR family transcriptional regulator